MRAFSSSLVLAAALCGCQPKPEPDLLKQQRHELAAAQSAEAAAALGRGDYLRAVYAAELAAQYDPFDPANRELAMRVSLAQVAALRPNLSLEQFGRLAYQAEVLEARDPANKHIYQTVRAIDAFARGDGRTAETLLSTATLAKPDFAPAWLMQGDVLQAGRKLNDALASYEQAEKLDPKNVRAVSNLGLLAVQVGDLKKAIEKLLRAIELEDTAPVRQALGNVYLNLNRPMDSLPHFARATQLEPRDGRYRVNLGEVHLRLDQIEEAAVAFRDGAALGAEPWASRGLGAVLLKKKDYAAADAAFKRVLAMSPEDVSTLFFAAETQEGLSRPAEAAKLYTRFTLLAEKLPAENTRLMLARDRLARLPK